MKKYIITTIAILVGIFMTSNAFASSSISLSQSSVNVVAGKTFNVVVAVNPNGVSNYTASVKIKYPADLVSVNGYTQDSAWMPLSQSKYNLIDNTNGEIIKTAGYVKGFSTTTTFGTITFTALKTGTGVIQVENGTIVLDASSQNVFAGSPEVTLNVSTSTASVSKTATSSVTTQGTSTTGTGATVVKGALVNGAGAVVSKIGTSSSTVSSSTASTSGNINPTASVFGSGSMQYLGYILGAIIIIALIVWLVIFLVGKKKRNGGNKVK